MLSFEADPARIELRNREPAHGVLEDFGGEFPSGVVELGPGVTQQQKAAGNLAPLIFGMAIVM